MSATHAERHTTLRVMPMLCRGHFYFFHLSPIIKRFISSIKNKDIMKHISYTTHGTCSQHIDVVLDDENRIHDVSFIGGCNGNLKGICSLVKGQKATDVISRLKGLSCNGKPTSCPDQLATALEQAME